jgi:leucyl aminopeptidase
MIKTTALTFAALRAVKRNVCVAFGEKDGFPPILQGLDTQSEGMIARATAIAKFDGSKKALADILAPHGLDIERLLIMGMGEVSAYNETDWMALGGRVRTRLGGAQADSADVILELSNQNSISGKAAAQLALGAMLRGYEFKKYKKKKKENGDDDNGVSGLKSLRILCRHPEEAKTHFEYLKAVGEGVLFARDLVNEPANILGPVEFAERVTALMKRGLEVEVLDQERLEAIGMGALLAVGQGSVRPSQVVVMQWNGGKKGKKPIAFVGKGVCFDSGGISIKPAQGMEDMKGDMGGAAAVTGAMLALAERKAPVNAVGIIGLVENMPSGTAQRPGDIVTSLSGQTIEVLNTDAEGRMVLADIMWYAQERFTPQAMITLATLTGAVVIALGKEHAGLLTNSDELAERVTTAGLETGDKVWRLPLDPKYNKQMDSKIADMRNAGSREAGSITAAQFLQRFVKEGTIWAHLDVAGTAMASPTTDISQSWASGYGVMLLDRLVSKYYESR